MAERVFITGMGLITAIGDNVMENLRSLRLQQAGVGHTRHIDTIHKDVLPVAEVRHSTEQLAVMAGVPDVQGYTRTTLLGLIAIRFPGQKLKWNDKSGRFTNNRAANAFLEPAYRQGWKLEG